MTIDEFNKIVNRQSTIVNKMSLYRKYRPQTFEDVVGQEHIAQTLRNALGAERWAHAYLFCGPRGTGKTTSARLLAKCLNCEQGPTAIPCNKCDFCVRVRDNQAVMDLIEIDAASNTGVDNVRENIIEKVNVAPAQGRFRVYIIDEVHMLSVSSFNALLKTLEEPPAHAVFVLATTDAHKVPTTITSRCQRFDFRRVGPGDIVRRLQYVAHSEGIQLEDNAARLIARTADGALRDALTLLEQVAAFSPETIAEADVRLVLGTVSEELLLQLIDAVADGDPAQALHQIERATDEGVSFMQLTRDLTNYCRELLLLTVGFESNGVLSDKERQRQHEHSQRMGRARLMQCVEALRAAEKEMRQSTDHRLLLELTLVRAASLEDSLTAAPVMQAKPQPAVATQPAVQPAWRQPQPQAPRVQSQPPSQPPVSRKPLEPQETTPSEVTPVNGRAHSEDESKTVTQEALSTARKILTERPEKAVNPIISTDETIAIDGYDETVEVGSPDLTPLTGEAVAGALAESVAAAAVDSSEMEAVTDDAAATPELEVAPVVETAALGSEVITEAVPPSDAGSPIKKKGRRIHNLEEFVELWGAVLLRIKKKIGVSAVAYLHDAWPVGLDDTEAVLEFKKEFHYAKACEAATRLPFEQVLNECMASPRRLRFQLAKAPAKRAPAPAPEPQVNDDEEDDDVLTVAQELFAAEVVGRSGGG